MCSILIAVGDGEDAGMQMRVVVDGGSNERGCVRDNDVPFRVSVE